MAAMLALRGPVIVATTLGTWFLRPRSGGFLSLGLRLDMLVLAQLFTPARLPLGLTLPGSTLGLAVIVGVAARSVARRRADLKLIELVPFRIGAIPVRDGQQLADTAPRIDGLWIIHAPYYEPLAALDSTVAAPTKPRMGSKRPIRPSVRRPRPI